MIEATVADDLTGEAPALLLVTPQDVEEFAEEFAAYHAHFAPLYARREQRGWAEIYLRGLLVADVPRKNVEAIALRLCGAGAHARRTVRALQQFLGEGAWDDDALLAEHQRLVEETLGEDDGVLLVDGSDVAKQGTHSVGVARQWCGSTGKKDNCQAGVSLGYASRKGYTLLDRRLYLHEAWFAEDHRERWRACAIPDDVPFQTKPHLAATMVEGVMQAHRLRARWLVCDEGYGQDPAFLDRVAACGLWYMAEVSSATHVWPLIDPATGEERARPMLWVPPQVASRKGPVPTTPRLHPASPPSLAVAQIAAALPPTAWHRYRLLEGSKGPLVADFAALRAVAVRDRLPGPDVWLLLRRPLPTGESGPEEDLELKYYLSCAPPETPLAALVRVSGLRWPIEACFAEGNEEVGLDHYETRFWRGWHHHMTLVILAHHFLVRMQQRLHQRGGACSTTAPAAHRAAAAALRTAGVPGPSDILGPADADPAAAAQSGGSARPTAVGVTAAPHRRGCGPGSGTLPPAAQGDRLSLPPQTPVAPA